MNSEPGGTSEIVGIIVAFVILLITFGSLIAAGMPIISAIIGLGSSVGIIALLTYIFDIPNFTLTLAVMIGLAVGIDYSLFILFRLKNLRKRCRYCRSYCNSSGYSEQCCNIRWSYSYDCCLWFITCRNRLLSGYGIRFGD